MQFTQKLEKVSGPVSIWKDFFVQFSTFWVENFSVPFPKNYLSSSGSWCRHWAHSSRWCWWRPAAAVLVHLKMRHHCIKSLSLDSNLEKIRKNFGLKHIFLKIFISVKVFWPTNFIYDRLVFRDFWFYLAGFVVSWKAINN